MPALNDAIAQCIAEATDRPFSLVRQSPVSGGCISEATLAEGEDGRRYFVKVKRGGPPDLFEAEAAGLRAMRATDSVRVPEVIGTGRDDGAAFLILEALDLGGSRPDGAQELGVQLAAMHRATGPGFGFSMDNYIGEIRQYNTPSYEDWPAFYREKRLQPQLDWAAEKGLTLRGADELLERVPSFFEHYSPAPSLLHGDLWGGNIDTDSTGYPVLYDPACYYGDREADIAFTELFGGPGAAFYQAYNQHWPLDSGYPQRKTLYNLYHIINHYNHFGAGYARQAQSMIDALLR